MKDDPLDLPRRPKVEILPREAVSNGPPRLTEQQMNKVIDVGARVAADVGDIVKELAAIHRIRAQGRADVERIEAKTRHVVEKMRAGIDRLAEQRQGVRTRAQAAVEILSCITPLLQAIPEVDSASRKALLESLPRLIDSALNATAHGK